MRKRVYLFAYMLLLMVNIVGCKASPIPLERTEIITQVEEPTTQNVTIVESEINEFALYVDDVLYALGDEDTNGEIINKIRASKNAQTPRGVGIGDTLDDLQKTYSGLKYEANWFPDKEGPIFNRVYIYAPEGSRQYIAFFLYKKEIVMIAVEHGDDYVPGIDIGSNNLFGIQGVLRETDKVSSKGMAIHYFYTNDVGKEITLLELYARSTYEVDIDDDGITELVVYLTNDKNRQSLGIYDMVNRQISYIDVNEKMGCQWSSGLENYSNLKPEYKKCIEIGYEKDDDFHKSGLYKVLDNELIYVCPFSNAVLM